MTAVMSRGWKKGHFVNYKTRALFCEELNQERPHVGVPADNLLTARQVTEVSRDFNPQNHFRAVSPDAAAWSRDEERSLLSLQKVLRWCFTEPFPTDLSPSRDVREDSLSNKRRVHILRTSPRSRPEEMPAQRRPVVKRFVNAVFA